MPSQGPPQGAWELNTMERRYSVPPAPAHHRSSTALAPHGYLEPPSPGPPAPGHGPPHGPPRPHHHQRSHSGLAIPSNSEDLHAWSIYRQNLNSDFTDSALGSSEKSPLPYGNFQLRDSTVHSILSHPRYGPKSALGANMYTYLKFGLPRVFPPSRGGRDGSSGYDSSDDQGSPHHGGHGGHGLRYGLRSRSDPDFRSHPPPHPQHPPPRPYSGVGGRHGGGGGGGRGDAWRAKSSSEANLLSPETMYRHGVHGAPHDHEHRRSVHDLRAADLEHAQHAMHAMHTPPGLGGRGVRPVSKAGSHASLALSRRGLAPGHGPGHGHAHLDDHGAAAKVTAASELGHPGHPYYPGAGLAELGPESPSFPYPHLQVRGLEVESRRSKRHLILQGVSLEVRGGELMAIMATSAEEGTVLLDALAGRASPRAGRVHGDILLNGQCLPRRALRHRVAYVRSERTLNPYLSVEQTLYFTNWLRRPGYQGAKTDTEDRIAALVEDLGLEQVRHTKVYSLTTSERRRLAVASQLLLDTDVLVLDRPTAGMDIFDTFFLVEFLRQWAGHAAGSVTGRAVVMTLHPPTYEIFTMLSRVALMSKGRLMYCGRRRDMLPYFANAEYPCPAYKNPSDYYLDLVTLDDLSAEAMLESSQRIEQLAEVFRRREEPLSEPGPPAGLPPSVTSANAVKQAVALAVCWSVYSQPGALARWLAHLVVGVLLSLCLGVVWWDVAASDPQLLLGDRVGFLYAALVVMPWPLLLMRAGWGDGWWRAVADDIRDGLYGRLVYILCQILYGLLPSAVVWAAYVVPAYTMTGLQNQASDPNAFYIYTGYSLLYLLAMQSLLEALSVALGSRRSRRAAGLLAGLLMLPLALLGGPLLHERDLAANPWLQYVALASPVRWVLPTLARREYAPDVVAASVANIMCRNKQVQHQDIIVQLPCPPPNASAALQYHGLGPGLDWAALSLLGAEQADQAVVGAKTAAAWMEPGAAAWPAIALAVFWAAFAVLACIAFPVTALRMRARRRTTSHKP